MKHEPFIPRQGGHRKGERGFDGVETVHEAERGRELGNAAVVLVGVACVLPHHQIGAQPVAFETEGNFTERLYRTHAERTHRA